ncbi:type I inositol polyphosphate 5-phosphatase 8-like [Apium graveolens]|uniref:type I inositol polyphosphate 5-phosphatase 8-like n=1 Tax=Apium graveolens TaxID=4045 RepID=UPI003D7B8B27
MAMNHTLQRSAYSFRRQGSSGRIWDDSYLSKSCELLTPRKVHDTRFSSELRKTKIQDSRFSRESSVSMQQPQPSIPLRSAPSRKQRVQRARPGTFECLACFRRRALLFGMKQTDDDTHIPSQSVTLKAVPIVNTETHYRFMTETRSTQRTRRFGRWSKRKHKRTNSQNKNDVPGQVADEDIDEEDYVSSDIQYCRSSDEVRVFLGTWNVAGRSPVESLAVDLDKWLNIKEGVDIYVLGFQEIVPLIARTVIGVEDLTECQKWNLLIGQALNAKFDFFRDTLKLKPMDSESYQYMRVSEREQKVSTKCGTITPMAGQQNTQYEYLNQSSSYMLIASKKMVGVFVSVWMKKTVVESYHISVRVSSVACGIMGYLGNKGSVSVSISIEGTTFCFTAAHLASGEKKGDEVRRNHQVSEIFRRTTFTRLAQNVDEHHPLTILGHDRIFWFGDLNYRLYSKDNLARQLIKEQDWAALQEFDQLQQELEDGGVFEGWKEGNIEFAPTYKYSKINSNHYSGGTGSRRREKKRTPAWCDRILWYGKGVKQLSYFRSESKFSDHRPVSAIFTTYIVLKSANPRLTFVPSKYMSI